MAPKIKIKVCSCEKSQAIVWLFFVMRIFRDKALWQAFDTVTSSSWIHRVYQQLLTNSLCEPRVVLLQ